MPNAQSSLNDLLLGSGMLESKASSEAELWEEAGKHSATSDQRAGLAVFSWVLVLAYQGH